MSLMKELQVVARDVLTEFNATTGEGGDNDGLFYVELKPVSGGRPDRPAPPVEKSHRLQGVARGVSQQYVDNTNILSSDLQCTVAINPLFKPDAVGYLRADGIKYKIVKVLTIPPVGVPVANVIVFRK